MATISSREQPRLQGQVQPRTMGTGTAAVVWATAVLALAAAVAGLVIDGVYTGARSTAEILRGYDVVTAVLVAPALAVAVGRARRGSLLGRLVTAGLLADLVYGYAFYVFATDFNDLFLLHVAVFSSSLIAMVLTIGGLDIDTVSEQFRGTRQVWPVAVALGILAISLGGMWIAAAVVNAVNGTVPVGSRLVESTELIHTSAVLDLAASGAVVCRGRRAAVAPVRVGLRPGVRGAAVGHPRADQLSGRDAVPGLGRSAGCRGLRSVGAGDRRTLRPRVRAAGAGRPRRAGRRGLRWQPGLRERHGGHRG